MNHKLNVHADKFEPNVESHNIPTCNIPKNVFVNHQLQADSPPYYPNSLNSLRQQFPKQAGKSNQLQTLKLATYNCRSIRAPRKRRIVLDFIDDKVDIAILTETWLNFPIRHAHPQRKIIQSPHHPYQGVALISNQQKCKLTPVIPSIWTKNLVVGRLQKPAGRRLETSCYIIGCYWPPKEAKLHIGKVEAVVKHLSRKSPGTSIVLAGDLNIETTQAIQLLKDCNLFSTADPQDPMTTYINTASKQQKQLDHFFVSQGCFKLSTQQDILLSDHRPLILDLQMRPSTSQKIPFKTVNTVRSLSTAEERQIFCNQDWPNCPFEQVADSLGYCEKIRRPTQIEAGLSFIEKKRLKQLEQIQEESNMIVKQKTNMSTSQTIDKLQRIWSSHIPKLFLKSLDSPFQELREKILNKIRCEHSKEYFQGIKTALKLKSYSPPVTSFAAQVTKDEIVNPISIEDYLRELYQSNNLLDIPRVLGPQERSRLITQEEVETAIRRLKRKATGTDQLQSRIIMKHEHRSLLVKKLTHTFNEWLQNHAIPKYVTTGRLMVLSKEQGSHYPQVGKIRTISMGNGIFKILESTILRRLQVQIKSEGLIHQNQRGFQPQMTTGHNLKALTDLIDLEKQRQQSFRQRKIPTKHRPKAYLLFVDLQKAFDRVQKPFLIQQLLQKGIQTETIQAISTFLANTGMQMEQTYIPTRIGVPQGAKLSPTLFTLYIDDLVHELNTDPNTCLAFADDLVIYCPNSQGLDRAITQIHSWSNLSGIEMNTQKSAILKLRVDRRTPNTVDDTIRNIPILQEYKYLGITIDDSLQLRHHNQTIQDTLNSFKRAINSNQSKKMPPFIKYTAWQSLIFSKVQYGTFLLVNKNPRMKLQVEKFLYQSFKLLLGIRANPARSKLLQTMLGTDVNNLIEAEHSIATNRTRNRRDEAAFHIREAARENIKRILVNKSKKLIQVLCDNLLCKSRHKSHNFFCPCGQRISQKHLFACPRLENLWDQAAEKYSLASGKALRNKLASKSPQLTGQQWIQPLTEAVKHLLQLIKDNCLSQEQMEKNQYPSSTDRLCNTQTFKKRQQSSKLAGNQAPQTDILEDPQNPGKQPIQRPIRSGRAKDPPGLIQSTLTKCLQQ